MSLIDRLVALRAASLSTCPLFYDHPGARERIREMVRRVTEHRILETDGRVRAWIGWWHETRSRLGVPLQPVLVDWVLDDPGAFDWVSRELRRVAHELGPHTDLELSPGQRALLEPALSLRLDVYALVLVGRPVPALAQLIARHDPARDLRRHGLDLAPLRAADVEAVQTLRRWVFNAEPEHCFFGASEAFLEVGREDLLARAREDPGLCLVARNGDEVVGCFSADVDYNPWFGRTAGMDLVLDERFRGRGIAKTAYRLLLEHLVDAGVDVFKGGTSRPAVLGLGRTMGRVLWGIALGRRGFFEPSHFESWL